MDEEIRKIFKNIYKMDQLYHDISLFRKLIGVDKDTDVCGILIDVYTFYKKHTGSADIEWSQLCREARELNEKYKNNNFCRSVLVEILAILESYGGIK